MWICEKQFARKINRTLPLNFYTKSIIMFDISTLFAFQKKGERKIQQIENSNKILIKCWHIEIWSEIINDDKITLMKRTCYHLVHEFHLKWKYWEMSCDKIIWKDLRTSMCFLIRNIFNNSNRSFKNSTSRYISAIWTRGTQMCVPKRAERERKRLAES